MTRSTGAKIFIPIVILFLTLNGLFAVGKPLLQQWNADQRVLLIGNTFLALITLLSAAVSKRGLTHPNPQAFVRSVYGSILLKLFLCMIAATIYIAVYRKALNKPAFFTLMGLYLVYTFLEVSVLTKALKQQKNA